MKIAKWSHLGIRVKVGPTGGGIESRAFMEVCGDWFQDKKNNTEAMVIVRSSKRWRFTRNGQGLKLLEW